MERLTGNALTLSDGTKLYDLTTIPEKDTCAAVCKNHKGCYRCPIQKAIDRLAAYEDTGLEPEEIPAIAEKIKQIILERFKDLDQTMQEIPAGFDKINTAVAMDELTRIYSQIFGITYDEAADELRSE